MKGRRRHKNMPPSYPGNKEKTVRWLKTLPSDHDKSHWILLFSVCRNTLDCSLWNVFCCAIISIERHLTPTSNPTIRIRVLAISFAALITNVDWYVRRSLWWNYKNGNRCLIFTYTVRTEHLMSILVLELKNWLRKHSTECRSRCISVLDRKKNIYSFVHTIRFRQIKLPVSIIGSFKVRNIHKMAI